MPKHAVFLIGENEYKSERTMPPIAHELILKRGMSVSVLTAKPNLKSIPGMSALDDADLLVAYLRFTQLPGEQLEKLRAYLDSGRPVVGLRTSTHAFRYPGDSKHVEWNNFGAEAFGTNWKFHYGGGSNSIVYPAPGAENDPLLNDVGLPLRVRSWLYYVHPLPDSCEPVLLGSSVGPSGREEREVNPVAWTKTDANRRVFYTSLGHPEEFELPSFRQLLFNGIDWALNGG